jgi:hypothetical protein
MASKRRRSSKIAQSGQCGHCLQYEEDCECCPECGGVDVHEAGCGEATKRRRAHVSSAPPPTPPTPRMRQKPLSEETELVPQVVVRVDDTFGFESTEARRATVSSRRVVRRRTLPSRRST